MDSHRLSLPPICASTGQRRLLFLLALLLTASLALVTPTPAPAQNPNVPAGAVAFRNSTNMTIVVETESYTNNAGLETPLQTNWTFTPGQYYYLTDAFGGKIYAKKLTYKVKASGKESRWATTSNGNDANGYFNVVYTQDNLNAHLGAPVIQNPGFVPQPPSGVAQGGGNPDQFAPQLWGPQPAANGPTQAQLQNATAKIIIAVIAHEAARRQLQKANPDFGDILAETLARKIRDVAIESATRDLFPGLTQRQSRDVQSLVSSALDGRLNLGNGDAQAAKQRLVNDLRANNPDMANAAVIADFIYAIYQAKQR
jgi:hypothetical protein